MKSGARLPLALFALFCCAGVKETNSPTAVQVPAHLARWPGLYLRQGQTIVDAPAEDQQVAKGYPSWPNKGPIHNGMRLTLMVKKTEYKPSEEVRVIHVFEAPGPGIDVYVMGPKFVFGESVDGKLSTRLPPTQQYPWVGVYDGAVLKSPAVDYNYDITSYRFPERGTHTISWQLGALRSNVISVEVMDDGSAAAAPLFAYEEEGDTVSFFPPRTMNLVRRLGSSGHACPGELPEHGNMWSGSEVERAFRNAEVQQALRATTQPYSAESTGKLMAGAASLVWRSACPKCLRQPPAIMHLHQVLRTVLLNRRLVCQESHGSSHVP